MTTTPPATTYPAGTTTVKGATFDVCTDPAGNWWAHVSDAAGWATGPSKAELNTAIAAMVRKGTRAAAVSVPFLAAMDNIVRAGKATGIHAGNGNVLVTWDDTRESEQLNMLSTVKVAAPGDDPEADAKTWAGLKQAHREAGQALHAWEQCHRLELRSEVRRAVRDAVARDGGQQ